MQLGKLQIELGKLQDSTSQIYTNLKKAIFASKTLKKLQEVLPEAVPFIKGAKQEIAINNQDLIAGLKEIIK